MSKRALGKLPGSIEESPRAFDEGLTLLSRRVTDAAKEAAGRGESWLERVRAGLVALLAFFDDEPQLGRRLVAQSSAGAPVLQREERLFGVLSGLLSEGPETKVASAGAAPSWRVIRELVVGGVFSVIEARLHEVDGGSFVELAPSLMSFIVVPYLGEDAACAELAGQRAGADEARSRKVALPIRATYRTARVLRAIAASPHASNREIAKAAGLSDEGQTSKLLSRLRQRGLIENVGLGVAYGERNAWRLTASGRRLAKLSGYSVTADAVGSRGSARRHGGV